MANKQQIVIDRVEFMMWVQGISIARGSSGMFVAPDEVACELAKQALEDGQAVLFSSGGKLTGTEMALVDGEFVERYKE